MIYSSSAGVELALASFVIYSLVYAAFRGTATWRFAAN